MSPFGRESLYTVFGPTFARMATKFVLRLLTLGCIAITCQAETQTLGLPPIDGWPMASAAKIELGRKLFFDKRLSVNGTVSCATCHDPEKAFSDGHSVAKGVRDQLGSRNTPTLVNAALLSTQFWDGRRESLETQARDPFINPREHGFVDHNALLATFRELADYQQYFRAAYDVATTSATIDHVGDAIASYERTLIAGGSPFDVYFYEGRKNALSAAEKAGLSLFEGRARCSACHSIGPTFALFSDNLFHSTGVGIERIEARLGELAAKVVATRARSIRPDKTSDELVSGDSEISELGRFIVTLNPKDIGKFKTPSLRNVALTAPYLHDGSVASLEEVIEVELYARGGDRAPIILTPIEKSQLVSFLKALTSLQLPR